MRYEIDGMRDEPVVFLADEIEFGKRLEWGSATYRPLKLSLMKVRQHWDYEPQKAMPVIVWICGGAFIRMDRNVWAPELAFYAKRGFAVASVEYSTTAAAVFPQQIEDIKEAIRFLREHAEELHLDPDRFVIMGESAGAYLAGLAALTGEKTEKGDDSVRAAVLLYPPVALEHTPDPTIELVMKGAPDLTSLITEKSPAFYILHGMNDRLVSYTESEYLYDALEKAGVPADLYLVRGCDHADLPAYQTSVKESICAFLIKETK